MVIFLQKNVCAKHKLKIPVVNFSPLRIVITPFELLNVSYTVFITKPILLWYNNTH